MVAIDGARWRAAWGRLTRVLGRARGGPRGADGLRLAGLMGGALAAAGAEAADLPKDTADVLFHLYDGGGVTADGPALLIRKSLFDQLSVSGSYYVDLVSSASIDVVTTASPYHETREERSLGLDYLVQDSLISVSGTISKEPDYSADSASLDVKHDLFGGMTTLSLGYTRGWDIVGKHGSPGFAATADHWQYRLGATQILTPRWLMSLNYEGIADQGYLQSPYRVARVLGAATPERDPNTRASRSVEWRVVGDVGSHTRSAVRAQYRYFWDTWGIHAQTTEVGYSRYLGERWTADGYLRYYTQRHAVFYSNDFTTDMTYVSRNRQLGTFWDLGPGVKMTYAAGRVFSRFNLSVNAAYQWMHFHYSDFTDIRTGRLYAFNANVLELSVAADY